MYTCIIVTVLHVWSGNFIHGFYSISGLLSFLCADLLASYIYLYERNGNIVSTSKNGIH